MKPTASATSATSEGNCTDEVYNRFIAGLNSRFLLEVENGQTPVFTTDAPDLWETYLNAFPEGPERQHHNCHCCRDFVRRYGSLVRIDATGATKGDRMGMITVEESRAAMGFPLGYHLPSSHKLAMHMLGNAVCPPAAEYVVRAVAASLA